MKDETKLKVDGAPHSDMDDVYEAVEGKGTYKYIVLLAATLAFLTHMFFLFAVPYFLILPTARCYKSGDWKECTESEICSDEEPIMPYYLDKPVEFNFITELDWYCKKFEPAFYTASSFFAGTTVSVILVTGISDALGRMPLLIIGVSGNILAIVFFMFYTTPITCLITSFLVGFFTMANNSTSFNFLADSVPKKYREIYPSVMNTGWALGEIVLALIMWTGVHWRIMAFVMVVFAASFFIPIIWLRESPKFYFSKNQLFKAKRRLKNMANVNRVKARDIQLISPGTISDKQEEVSFSKRLKLACCDKYMLLQVIIITVLFSIGNMVFYAVSLNLENMSANPYVNGISLAIAEIAAYAISAVTLNKLGMKVSLLGSFAFTTIGLAGLIFYWEDEIPCLIFAFTTKFGSAAIDNLLYTMSGLVFPTEILGAALGIALLGTRIGNALAKPLMEFGYEIICGIMLGLSVSGIFLVLFIKPKKKENED